VAEMLYNILGEFSLQREQVVSTITDNGSNFVKAFKEFGCDFRVENDSDYYGKYEILNVS
jgi:hypothetical protein